MKRILLLLIICSFGLSFSKAEAQSPPQHYHDITASLNSLNRLHWKYLKSVIRDKSTQKVNKTKNQLIEAYRKQQNYVEQINATGRDSGLQNAVLKYYKHKIVYLEEDYVRIMDVDSIAMQSLNFVDAWIRCREVAADSLKKSEADLQQLLNTYRGKYGIKLPARDEKLKPKVERANAANTYYNEVNFIFLQMFIQHSYLIEAIRRNSISGIMQNQNALVYISDEAQEQLEAIADYNGDESLKKAADEIIAFYKKESEKDVSSVIDFYIQQDNMTRLQKIMDAKNARESTEQDRLQFEEAKSKYERAAESFGVILYVMRQNHSDMINKWENSGREFFKRHVP